MEIDPNVYLNNTKYVFKPPAPVKKGFNGFTYIKWSKFVFYFNCIQLNDNPVSERCTSHNLFADAKVATADPSIDDTILELSRAAASFAIISVFLMCMGVVFTCYTFLNPRYMYKRLAGFIHFISFVTCALVVKILLMSVDHAQENLTYTFPKGSEYR